MKTHRFPDGSEGYEYEPGDVVTVQDTVHGGWFTTCARQSAHCVVRRCDMSDKWSIRMIDVQDDPGWGTVSCYPWMISPSPETLANAIVVDEPKPSSHNKPRKSP